MTFAGVCLGLDSRVRAPTRRVRSTLKRRPNVDEAAINEELRRVLSAEKPIVLRMTEGEALALAQLLGIRHDGHPLSVHARGAVLADRLAYEMDHLRYQEAAG